MTRDTDRAVAQFVLPGPALDRECVEGWQQWVATRHDFVPAPRICLRDYTLMSPRDRQLHDLRRIATHVNLPMQDTPMGEAISQIMRSRFQNNALKKKAGTLAGLMLTGGGYQGKTETACEVAAAFEEVWLALHHGVNPYAISGTRDLHVPVAYIQTPVTAKPKSTCAAILDFYGADCKGMNLPQMIRQVKRSLRDHGTKVLLLDDITRLKMHRVDDQDTLDLIRAFMSMRTTLVLIGVDIPHSGLLGGGRHDPVTSRWTFGPPAPEYLDADDDGDAAATQTERRFDLLHLPPFKYDSPAQIAAWVAHLHGIEEWLRLLAAPPDVLTGGTMPEYLFRRTRGVVGFLERLIEDACAKAMSTGIETLTEDLLDDIPIDLGKRRRGAVRTDAEIPAVPPPPTTRRPRRRNTVFDDRGVAAVDGHR